MIRVSLPYHLRTLAGVGMEVPLAVTGVVSPTTILDSLEDQYPMLRGTLRDQQTGQRRPLVRFFTCGEDVSLDPMDAPLPEAVVRGKEPFLIIGAIAGG